MSFAYTSKPATSSEDDKPEGWDQNWPFPGPKPPDWPPDDGDISFTLTASIPDYIYCWTSHTLDLSANDITGQGRTYDGTGAAVAYYLMKDGALMLGAAEKQDGSYYTSGWSSNSWSKTIDIYGEWLENVAELPGGIMAEPRIESDGNVKVGTADSAVFSIPAFVPILPEDVQNEVQFNYSVECRDSEGGSVLSGYWGDGAYLQRTWYGSTDGGDTWEELSDTQVSTTSSGWTDGVFSGTATLSSITDYDKVALKISIQYTDRSVIDIAGVADVTDADVIAAIRERQIAVEEPEDNLLDLNTAYDLSTLKTKVNDIAPNYIADNSYDGGSAKPAMLGSRENNLNYADSATSKIELFSLVRAMLITKEVEGEDGFSSYDSYGEGVYTLTYDFVPGDNAWMVGHSYPQPVSWHATAADNAESDYSLDTSVELGYLSYYFETYTTFSDDWVEHDNEDEDYGTQSAMVVTQRLTYSHSVETHRLTKARFYIKAEKASIQWSTFEAEHDWEKREWDDHGLGVQEGVYTLVRETEWNDDSSKSLQFGATSPPADWPEAPDAIDHDTSYYEESVRGFHVPETNMFMLVEWDFNYK